MTGAHPTLNTGNTIHRSSSHRWKGVPLLNIPNDLPIHNSTSLLLLNYIAIPIASLAATWKLNAITLKDYSDHVRSTPPSIDFPSMVWKQWISWEQLFSNLACFHQFPTFNINSISDTQFRGIACTHCQTKKTSAGCKRIQHTREQNDQQDREEWNHWSQNSTSQRWP